MAGLARIYVLLLQLQYTILLQYTQYLTQLHTTIQSIRNDHQQHHTMETINDVQLLLNQIQHLQQNIFGPLLNDIDQKLTRSQHIQAQQQKHHHRTRSERTELSLQSLGLNVRRYYHRTTPTPKLNHPPKQSKSIISTSMIDTQNASTIIDDIGELQYDHNAAHPQSILNSKNNNKDRIHVSYTDHLDQNMTAVQQFKQQRQRSLKLKRKISSTIVMTDDDTRTSPAPRATGNTIQENATNTTTTTTTTKKKKENPSDTKKVKKKRKKNGDTDFFDQLFRSS
jgi:hypothetical protein